MTKRFSKKNTASENSKQSIFFIVTGVSLMCVCGGKGVSLCRIITRDKGGIFWRVASQKTQQLGVWGLLCVRVPSTDSSWIFDRSKCGYNVSKHTLSPDSELLSGPMMICLRRDEKGASHHRSTADCCCLRNDNKWTTRKGTWLKGPVNFCWSSSDRSSSCWFCTSTWRPGW